MLGQTDTNQHKEVSFGEVFYFFIFLCRLRSSFLLSQRAFHHIAVLFIWLWLYFVSPLGFISHVRETHVPLLWLIVTVKEKQSACCSLIHFIVKKQKKRTFLNVSVMQLLKKTTKTHLLPLLMLFVDWLLSCGIFGNKETDLDEPALPYSAKYPTVVTVAGTSEKVQ